MLNKIVSLSKNEDFKGVLAGKRISNKYFTVFFKKLLNKEKNNLSISFTVKKKEVGSAVKRNKIKRILKATLNTAIKDISINMKYSYLVIGKETVLKDEYNNIKKTFFADFKKIK